ncbi:hypothetical protein HOY82DRAFT_612008 [Tuber indicum]|nr:hypothetical protein HOY82DRAFT_612008 [Tuber indicum]
MAPMKAHQGRIPITDEEPLLAPLALARLQVGSAEAEFLVAFCPIQDVPYFTVIEYILALEVKTGGFCREHEGGRFNGGVCGTVEYGFRGAAGWAAHSWSSPTASFSYASPSTVADFSGAPGMADILLLLPQLGKRERAASWERLWVSQLPGNDKKEREARRGSNVVAGNSSSTSIAGRGAPKSRPPTEAALSFLMLDGVRLRAGRPSSGVLVTDVRRFADERCTEGDCPSCVLRILMLLTNKHINISELDSTMSELDLSPTCTHVLAPTCSSPASAYRGRR